MIVFDNAVEAALKSSEKIVRLVFEDHKIKISNSYNNEDLDYFKSKKSAKGRPNRINGLQLLSSLLENTELVMVSTIDEMVHIEMMVTSND